MGAFHYYDLEYCETFIFDEFLINQLREGVTVTFEHNEKLREVIAKHFSGKPMVYISNRIYSYAVDPTVYAETAKIENLKAMCIVTEDFLNVRNAKFESNFYAKPFEVFGTLGDAIIWAKNFLAEVK